MCTWSNTMHSKFIKYKISNYSVTNMKANTCQPTMVQRKCESHHLFWQVTYLYKIPQVSLCSGLAIRTWCVIMKSTCSKLNTTLKIGGMQWRSWLRHCATSWKVAGSIPNGVTGFFHWHNPSGCTLALGSTQPLTEMSTRNVSWEVKAASV
jgi:hypothetical protein